MNRHFSAGIAAGSIASFQIMALQYILPNLYWGTLPFLAGIIPAFAGLLTGHTFFMKRALSAGRIPPVTRRIAPFTLALLMPLALYGLYTATESLAFISGERGIVMFLFPLMLSLLLMLPAIDAVTSSLEEKHNDTPMLLAGIGIGGAIIGIVFGAFPSSILLVWLLHALLTLFPLLPGTERVHDSAITPKQKAPRQKLALPSRVVLPLFIIPGMAGISVLVRVYSEIPHVWEASVPPLVAALVAAAGFGALLGQRAATTSLAPLSAAFAVTGAAVMALAAYSYVGSAFHGLYISYYEGTSPGMWTLLFPLLLVILPVFSASAALAADSATRGHSREQLMLILVAGFVGTALVNASHWQIAIRAVPAMLVLLSLWYLIQSFRRNKEHLLIAIVATASIAGLIALPWMGFYTWLDPMRFRVSEEVLTPAGRMTLLQSRDYDDPFYALLWKQTRSLTQSSRTVQSGLYRMGHIPMLMAPRESRVLVLGLGSALPLEAILMHEPAEVVCVEAQAVTITLADAPAKDKRPRPWLRQVRFHAERVESYLRRSENLYDVIVCAEPFAVPTPSPALLTNAMFHDVSRLLAPRGVFVQWIPLSRIGVDGLRSVAAGFCEVFPHTEMWIATPDPENAMIGLFGFLRAPTAAMPSPLRFNEVKANPGIAFHFLGIEFDSFPGLLSAYGMDDASLRRFAGEHTAPRLLAPLALLDPLEDPEGSWNDTRSILQARTSPDRILASMPDSSREKTMRLFNTRPMVFEAHVNILHGEDQRAAAALTSLVSESPDNAEARRALGDLMLRQAAGYVGAEEYEPASNLLAQALALIPVNTYLLRLMMITAMQIGDRETTGLSIDGLKRLDPLHAGYRDNHATIRAQQGATNDALLLYESAITLDRKNEEFYCNMASFHFSQGRAWEAVRVLDQAIDQAWYIAKPLYLRGLFYAERGRYDLARESWEEYLRVASPLDPSLNDARMRLETLPR